MNTAAKDLQAAAQRLMTAASSGEYCSPVRDLLGTSDLQGAYAVQQMVAEQRIKQGATIVGRKIGLTSKAVQNQLGVNQPDFGLLFDTMRIEDGDSISFKHLTQPRIEAEIAFILKDDLPAGALQVSDLIESVGEVVAALEIVGSRIAQWDIKITDTIADNASASHFILGSSSKSIEDTDLIDCQMNMYKNGTMVSEGHGRDCLGSPLESALWLAQTMFEFGNPLKSGDIILTGGIGTYE